MIRLRQIVLIIFSLSFFTVSAYCDTKTKESDQFIFNEEIYSNQIQELLNVKLKQIAPDILEELRIRNSVFDVGVSPAVKFAATIDDFETLKHFCLDESRYAFYLNTLFLDEKDMKQCLVPQNKESQEALKAMNRDDTVNAALGWYKAISANEITGLSKEALIHWLEAKLTKYKVIQDHRNVIFAPEEDIETARKHTLIFVKSNTHPSKWSVDETRLFKENLVKDQNDYWKQSLITSKMLREREDSGGHTGP